MLQPPTAFPVPGTYGVSQMITLRSDTPGATIHFTTDGSVPTPACPVFDPFVLPVVAAVDDGPRGVRTTYTINAITVAAGQQSAVATFTYVIDRRDADVYSAREVEPGLYMIVDNDDTKMYLVVGSARCMLVDAGLANGNLRAFVQQLVGDKPLDVFVTHGHPDHVAALGQFEDAHDVYMSHHDLAMAASFRDSMGFALDLTGIFDIHEGMRFDLGGWVFDVYHVPGHSAGSMVLHDAARGVLIAGDAFGSNRPTITDSLWMQFPGMATIDAYQVALLRVRRLLAGKVRVWYGGHNDVPMYGERYFDALQIAVQRLVDDGDACLVPSLRPAASDVWQVVVGDRLTDPDWAAINVRRGACLAVAPAQNAALALLVCDGQPLPIAPVITLPALSAGVQAQTLELLSSASAAVVRLDGVVVAPGRLVRVLRGNTAVITVTAADGVTTQTYQVKG
jgi:glyoxylase-like metal-dependent hydrolase (beta-lactamase superfamily II)